MVTVTDHNGYIRVEYNSNVLNYKKQKVTVKAKGDNVLIFDNDMFNTVEYPYTYFSAPSGSSAQAIADAIAAFLD